MATLNGASFLRRPLIIEQHAMVVWALRMSGRIVSCPVMHHDAAEDVIVRAQSTATGRLRLAILQGCWARSEDAQ